MIQRIQTVYLLIALLLQVAQLFLRWSTYLHGEDTFYLNGLESTVGSVSAIPLTVVLALSIAAVLITLLRFKDRPYQMRLASISILTVLLSYAGFAWVHYQNIEALKAEFESMDMGYGVPVAMPLIACILIWLARKAIKKDDQLVKSVDRLR